MPRVMRRSKQRFGYTDQERRVLLTGVPLSATSTRFGFPRSVWHVDEIRRAWDLLKADLLVEWQGAAFDRHRNKHAQPWAERFLQEQDP